MPIPLRKTGMGYGDDCGRSSTFISRSVLERQGKDAAFERCQRERG